MFDEPIRLTKALQAINARKDRTTHLKSREIAMAWNAEARARAFFSARVASATILSELHNKVQAVVEGRMTKGQARALLQRYFVGEGADALAALGFAPQGEGGGVAELASAARLRLILDMNVNMAQECGEYRRWAEMKDIYRYGMWKCGYAKEHREEHLARDGKVYAFDHPIWTESPPGGEFNCHCYRVLLREEDVLERGITPEPMDVPFAPSSLGFDPSRGMQMPKFGKRVRKEYREIAERQMAKFTQEQQQAQQTELPPTPAPAPEGHAEKRQRQWQEAYGKRLENWKAELASAGADNATVEATAKLYTPEAAKIGKPPKIVVDNLFSGAFLSKDGEELVVGSSLADKKTAASMLKAVKYLPHKLKRGRQWRIAKQHRTEREAKMLGARLIRGKHTWKQDLEATNPNYKTGKSEWTLNCQRCIFAYEARRRGIDVVAKPILDMYNDELVPYYKWAAVYTPSKIIDCSANSGSESYAKIFDKMKAMPIGVRCGVQVLWEGEYGGGHVFIAERRKDGIALIDPQNNREYEKDMFDRVAGNEVCIMRLDNKKFNDKVKLCAKERTL